KGWSSRNQQSHGPAWKAERIRWRRGGALFPRRQDQGDRRLLRDRRNRHLPGVAAVRTVSRHIEPEWVRGERAKLSEFHNCSTITGELARRRPALRFHLAGARNHDHKHASSLSPVQDGRAAISVLEIRVIAEA